MSGDADFDAMTEALDRDAADHDRDEAIDAMADAIDSDAIDSDAIDSGLRTFDLQSFGTVYIQILNSDDPLFGAGHLPPGATGPDWHGLDDEALTAAHCAIESELCKLRDARISVRGPANGFIVRERDRSDSPIMRLGTRDGTAIGIVAYLDCVKAKAMDGWPGLGEYLKAKGWLE